VRLGINGWRVHGERTGVGRYLLSLFQHWSPEVVQGRFEEINFYSPQPIDRREIPLPESIKHRLLAPNWRMLLWENLRFGPGADDDVLFCPSYTRPFVARGRTVVTTFEATLKLFPEYFPPTRWYESPQLYLALYGWSARNSTLVLTTTHAAAQDIARAYDVPSTKIRVVYLAPAEIFRPLGSTADLDAVRRQYFGEDAPYFLFVGKMTPRRNVPKLLQAYAQLKQRTRIPHKLLIVGKNTARIRIAEMASSLRIADDCVHLEYVSDEDLSRIYNAAHAFVLPYSYESASSLTALEAQATGLPVITCDSPGLRETTGGHAWFLPAAEVPEIECALQRFAEDPGLCRDLAEKGLEFARRFTWRRTAAETLDVLVEAAGAPS